MKRVTYGRHTDCGTVLRGRTILTDIHWVHHFKFPLAEKNVSEAVSSHYSLLEKRPGSRLHCWQAPAE
jgi:hypothetical protein